MPYQFRDAYGEQVLDLLEKISNSQPAGNPENNYMVNDAYGQQVLELLQTIADNLAGGGGGGGGSSTTSGSGAPTSTPTTNAAIYFDTDNGDQYNWYDGSWH
jgi:hypothetical protein